MRMLSRKHLEGLKLPPHCLFSEALMAYDQKRITLTSHLEFSGD